MDGRTMSKTKLLFPSIDFCTHGAPRSCLWSVELHYKQGCSDVKSEDIIPATTH